jgi:ABC-2 type transport system ATP-binding protein
VGADAIIVAEGLTKFYGRSRGIEDLNFRVNAGEVFGYLGPNGAGKTTTIRTTLDLMRPTRGRISVFGVDSHAGSMQIRERLGYLPGDLALYDHMTGLAYLTYFANLRGGVPEETFRGLADRVDCDLRVKIRSLSHGNRQKIGLIQAFMHSPDLLVLDEPSQGLDPLVQREFHSMVKEARDQGRTVFISSHVLPEVERLCDRVGIIRHGRLIAVEDVGDLKSRALRTIDFHFTGPVSAEAFERLPSVRQVQASGDTLHCTVAGPLDELIKTAARYEVVNVETAEASLEEIFLTYYGKGENGEP